MPTANTVGVIVARFHAPDLHPGHHFVISYVCERHTNVLVILDVQKKYADDHDPLPFEIRKQMVRDAFGGRPVTIVPLETRRHGYDVRSRRVDELIETHFPGHDATIYGSRDSVTQKYVGQIQTHEVPTIFPSSATAIRRDISIINSHDFRAGIIWDLVRREPLAYPTVDIAILDLPKDRVLLGRKEDEQDFRFPGGFFDVRLDDSLESAADREGGEEVRGIQRTRPVLIGSRVVNDWRYRKSKDKILTTLTVSTYLCGDPEPGDDIVEVCWFPLSIIGGVLVPEHRMLKDMLFAYLHRED